MPRERKRIPTTLLLGLLAAAAVPSPGYGQDPGGRPIGGVPPVAHVEPPDDPSATLAGASTRPPSRPTRRYSHRGSVPVRVGLGTFSTTWGAAMLVGSLMIRADSTAVSCADCRRNGALLYLPLVGPGVTLFLDDARGSRAFFGIVAGVQISGLLLAGFAAIPRRDRRPIHPYGSDVYVGASFDRLVLRVDF